MSDPEIDIFKRHLREFPTLDLTKLQKHHTKKCQEYADWCEKHCRMQHDSFQVRKCDDEACCGPHQLEDLSWLPDPELEDCGPHFCPYDEAKMSDMTEKYRPSLNKPRRKRQFNAGNEASSILKYTINSLYILIKPSEINIVI